MKNTILFGGEEHKVIGEVESKLLGRSVPLCEIKWMSDERWLELAKENCRRSFEMFMGVSADTAPEEVLDSFNTFLLDHNLTPLSSEDPKRCFADIWELPFEKVCNVYDMLKKYGGKKTAGILSALEVDITKYDDIA